MEFQKRGLRLKNKRLYCVWKGMIGRCNVESCSSYEYYGARGIKVCPEWSGKYGFCNFVKWSKESGYDENAKRGECTLDRKDSKGDYSPDNCRWANMKTQSNNTRRNRMIEYKGETKTLAQWVEELNLDYSIMLYRINRRGWDVEKAFKTPIRKRKSKQK